MHLTEIILLFCAIFAIAHSMPKKEKAKKEKKEEEKEWYYRKTNKQVSGEYNFKTFSFAQEKYFGPEDWGEVSKVCKKGKAQSPIDITSKKAKKTKFGPLKLKFEAKNKDDFFSGSFKNNGHAPTFTLDKSSGNITIKFDKKDYLLQQFHFHFGCKYGQGSEHKIDKKAYDAEMHLVFHNKKYKFEKAIKKKDGLLVIGVLIEKGEYYYYNKQDGLEGLLLGPISALVNGYVGIGVPIVSTELPLKKLVPALVYKKKEDAPAYYTYKGSLTTPGCYESVRWVVLKEPIKISQYLMDYYRQSRTKVGRTFPFLCDNYRPTQKLNKRKVEVFKPKKKKKKSEDEEIESEDEESEDTGSGNVGTEDDGSGDN